MKPNVIFYTKPDCPLCEKALAVLRKVHAELAFELIITDITSNKDLFNRYCFHVPVVLINGIEKFSGIVDEKDFRAAIRHEARRPNL